MVRHIGQSSSSTFVVGAVFLALFLLLTLAVVESKKSSSSSPRNNVHRKYVDVDAIMHAAKQKVSTSNNKKKKNNNYVKVNCPPGKSLLYRFRATTLIGNRGLVNSRKGTAGNAETLMYGKMILTCPSQSTTKKALQISGQDSDRKKNVVLVTFLNGFFAQYQGRSRGLSGRKYRRLMTSTDITKELNQYPMLFVQSTSGHIQSLVFRQSESRYMRAIKKGLLRLLTTETRKKARSQTDGFGGKYYKNYEKRFTRGKFTKTRRSLRIYQRFSHDDFISTMPVSKRHLHYDASHLVRVSLKKHVPTHASMKIKLTFGPSSDIPRHYAFEAFEKLTKESKRDKNPEPHSASELETLFIGSINLEEIRKTRGSFDGKIQETIVNLEKNGRGAKLGSEFAFENSFSVNKFDRKATLSLKRKQFSPRFFRTLLNGVKQDPSLSRESNQVLTALAKYSKLHPIKSADILLAEISKGIKTLNTNKLDRTSKTALKNYLESIQNLCATVKSSRVQEKLIQLSTMHPYLTSNYVYASIVIAYPTESVFSLLKTLKSQGIKAFARGGSKKYKIDDDYNNEVKENAFMAYADLANRLRDVRLQRMIVKEIVTRIGKSKDLTELTTNFHALNNAGKGVQVEILYMFLADDRVPDSIKVLIVENLKKRLRDEKSVDDMIHEILGSTGYSPLVKASLINAQSERELHLRRGTSIKHVYRVHKRSKNEEISTAAKNYLYTCGTHESGEALAKAMGLKRKKQRNNRRRRSSLTYGLVGRSLLSHEDLELLDNFESMEQKNVLFIRFFRRIGNAFRRAFQRVGHAFRRVGHAFRKVGSHLRQIAHRVGRGIVRIAKTVAKGVVKAVNWLKDKILAAINAVKKIVEKIKYYFSAAKFENQKACMQVSVNPNDQLCLYQSNMINFVRKQGDLSTIKKAKHFSFEKLLGTNAVHMYLGFLVYAGATFECSTERTSFDFVLIAKANMYAKLFKKQFIVIDAAGELTKRPDEPINDNIFVKVFETTFINKRFVPDRIREIIEACFSETKPLVEKRFPKLIDWSYQFQIGPVPVHFNFNVGLNMGVELRYGVCVERLEASVSVEPYISLSVTGSANVGIPVAKVGVYLRATITYRIIPRLAFEKCNLCAMLQHKLDGIEFSVGLTASLMKWSKEWSFFRTQTKAFVKTLFEKCIGAGGYKPSDNDSKKLELSKTPVNNDQQQQQESNAQQPQQQGGETQQSPNAPPTNPPGYQEPDPGVTNGKVDSPQELTKVAQEKGLGNWVKKTTKYKPLFGPHALRIPLNGNSIVPPKPGRQTLKAPVTVQQEKVWSSEFLTKHVPKEVIANVGIEKLRHLPSEYFHLKMEDRAKIPNTILDLPPKDFKRFIAHLPSRYNKDTSLVIPENAYTKVWSKEVLQKRLPKQIVQKVPIEYLRHLPEEVLQVRQRILSKVPVAIYEQSPSAVVAFICKNYKRLCKRLLETVKADTGMDIKSEVQQAQQKLQEQQHAQQQQSQQQQANNTAQQAPESVPQQQSPAVVPTREPQQEVTGNGQRHHSIRTPYGRIHLDINVNVNKKPQK
ncbi:hypothetical protein FDP41_004846 [Naegleria fowleri]|uniref:Vitellogenin domain-containing protein n=1 Tax=Naegleria fowleri TaxID=5763 RepID=A0A6A5BPK2_NAEFO|nr:uncharacterized protein FDP41_004846 [Naegleria fowleri]KAF0976171.1 hypothetical protein FDP41_004846 [Naegleria fowleri]